MVNVGKDKNGKYLYRCKGPDCPCNSDCAVGAGRPKPGTTVARGHARVWGSVNEAAGVTGFMSNQLNSMAHSPRCDARWAEEQLRAKGSASDAAAGGTGGGVDGSGEDDGKSDGSAVGGNGGSGHGGSGIGSGDGGDGGGVGESRGGSGSGPASSTRGDQLVRKRE